jgi:two-component system, OmpR family, KDP operon response regulator KdpE
MNILPDYNLAAQGQKVLLVCDRPEEIQRWMRLLPTSLFELVLAGSIERAFEAWADTIPDLILIDVNGTFPDGTEICRQLRQEAALPLLVVFEAYDEAHQLQAYQAGADDCLVKPLNPSLLLAKLNVWLRRSWMVPAETLAGLSGGGVRLDPIRRAAVFEDGRYVRLTNLELRLLTLLMYNPGRALSTGDIISRVWGFSSDGDKGAMLKNLVYRLRKKIEPDPNHPAYLLTDPGQGYRFVGKGL